MAAFLRLELKFLSSTTNPSKWCPILPSCPKLQDAPQELSKMVASVASVKMVPPQHPLCLQQPQGSHFLSHLSRSCREEAVPCRKEGGGCHFDGICHGHACLVAASTLMSPRGVELHTALLLVLNLFLLDRETWDKRFNSPRALPPTYRPVSTGKH